MELNGRTASDRLFVLKFAVGGSLAKINFKIGQEVKKGALLGQLNQTELQNYLDRALKYYEQVRADFDAKSNVKMDMYEARQRQAELDVSVKNVEIAKANLEATNLYVPCDGVIIEADSVEVGMNITPATYTITLLDPTSIYFEAEVSEDKLTQAEIGKSADITLSAYPGQTFKGKINFVGYKSDKDGNFVVKFVFENIPTARIGMTGKVIF